MSQIIEQAEDLRKRAIALLLSERQSIEDALKTLGHDGADIRPLKKCKVCGSADHDGRFHRPTRQSVEAVP